MTWLKTHAPLLLSPVFWGLTLSAFAKLIALNSWLDEATMNIVAGWLLAVCGVRIVWRTAEKINN